MIYGQVNIVILSISYPLPFPCYTYQCSRIKQIHAGSSVVLMFCLFLMQFIGLSTIHRKVFVSKQVLRKEAERGRI